MSSVNSSYAKANFRRENVAFVSGLGIGMFSTSIMLDSIIYFLFGITISLFSILAHYLYLLEDSWRKEDDPDHHDVQDSDETEERNVQ